MIFKPSATNNIFIEVNAYVAGFSKMCFETTQFNEPMKTHINQLNGGVTVNLTALRYHCNVSSMNCLIQQKMFIFMQTLTRLYHNVEYGHGTKKNAESIPSLIPHKALVLSFLQVKKQIND